MKHRKKAPPFGLNQSKTSKFIREVCKRNDAKPSTWATMTECYRLNSKPLLEALASDLEYPLLKTNRVSLSKLTGYSPVTIWRAIKAGQEMGLVVNKIFHGTNRDFELELHPGPYFTFHVNDKNTKLDLTKFFNFQAFNLKASFFSCSSLLKGNSKCELDAFKKKQAFTQAFIEGEEQGTTNERQRRENSQTENKKEPFLRATNERETPTNQDVSAEEILKFSNQIFRTITSRLFDGNYYTAEQRRWLRSVIFHHLLKAADTKNEFGAILAGTSEAARRNLTEGEKISEFIKNNGLNRLAEMGSLPSSSSSSINPSSSISTLAARMKINP